MRDHPQTASGSDSMPRPEWQEALDALERSLHEALRAVALLRHDLEKGGDEAPPSDVAPAPAGPAVPSTAPQAASSTAPPAAPSTAPQAAPGEGTRPPREEGSASTRTRAGLASFDRLWDRVEQERAESRPPEQAQASQPERRGLASLPQNYLMTVEDREGKVDLIPLYRALSSLSNVQEVTLASYANGVPIVSLRLEGEVDFKELNDVVSTVMDRECEVIPQDTGKIYVRMRARKEGSGA